MPDISESVHAPFRVKAVAPIWHLLLATALIVVAGAAIAAPTIRTRILFVGNSLTYYNAMPSMVKELLIANHSDRGVDVEILAEGGARLEQHLAGDALVKATSSQSFDVVVIQDLGGFPLCSESFPGCAGSRESIRKAAELVRHSGARPIWYSTWQGTQETQERLSQEVGVFARTNNIEVSDTGVVLYRYMTRNPRASVLLENGHPTPLGQH